MPASGDVWAHVTSRQGLGRKRWLLNGATTRTSGFGTEDGQAHRSSRQPTARTGRARRRPAQVARREGFEPPTLRFEAWRRRKRKQ